MGAGSGGKVPLPNIGDVQARFGNVYPEDEN